ncbi:hypothetical protein V8B55DRAFT_1383598 [Mucor lusitanicus]|uniref:Uncharacterized protein n=1 Tax=Mucor circinelloides f. lusitanicus TaxID=29924 RepID=A0A8H4F236_MUCCL|nr:hypothetical protein FB192DRAFT_1366878 [Mucor lusitanicus]
MKAIILLFLLTLFNSTQADQIYSSSINIQLQRPRQFLMDIYTRPNRKGMVQHMRLESERASTQPCWNLQSKHVGSVALNDPFVKVSFYRAADCNGFAINTFHGSDTLPRGGKYTSIIKAKSVSITRIRPILLRDTDRFHDASV